MKFAWNMFLMVYLMTIHMIDFGNGSAPIRWQAITWTNDAQVRWYSTLIPYDFIFFFCKKYPQMNDSLMTNSGLDNAVRHKSLPDPMFIKLSDAPWCH